MSISACGNSVEPTVYHSPGCRGAGVADLPQNQFRALRVKGLEHMCLVQNQDIRLVRRVAQDLLAQGQAAPHDGIVAMNVEPSGVVRLSKRLAPMRAHDGRTDDQHGLRADLFGCGRQRQRLAYTRSVAQIGTTLTLATA